MCLFLSFPACHGGGDVRLLPAFAATTKENNDRPAFAPVIDAIAGAEIAGFKPTDISLHSRCGYDIKSVKPFGKRRAPAFRVFPHLKRAVHIVSFMLPLSNPAIKNSKS